MGDFDPFVENTIGMRCLAAKARMWYLRSGVPGVPGDVRGEVGVAVVHADRVDLLLVTLDAVGGTDVVSEDPGFARRLRTSQTVRSTAGQQRRADCR